MKDQNQTLTELVLAAQRDSAAADALIGQYMSFIKSETAKFLHRPPREEDDELSIAMAAFYEAAVAYLPQRGGFLSLASHAIRNRLIDFSRREARHGVTLSLETTEVLEGETVSNTVADPVDQIESWTEREAGQREFQEFGKTLAAYGISYTEVAESCPRQDRTLYACHRALGYAREHSEIIDRLLKTGRLPIGELATGSGVAKKTLERHRSYMVAILLAYTNGFEIIRGHLTEVGMERRDRT